MTLKEIKVGDMLIAIEDHNWGYRFAYLKKGNLYKCTGVFDDRIAVHTDPIPGYWSMKAFIPAGSATKLEKILYEIN